MSIGEDAMAQASNKMVVGFNHNVKHQGKVYHVQTEDSGLDNPHVITHLFVGGNILASKRASYAEYLSLPDLDRHVRELMEVQHKEMLRELVNGAFDVPGAGAVHPGASDPTRPSGAPAAPLAMTEDGVNSIFTEDLNGEKSLDEVILSYLAGETDQT
jgi:hypothetical protein